MISFSGIEKTYQLGSQDVKALKKVEGFIIKGSMVALCGPSGSGKSTLLNILGLLDVMVQFFWRLSKPLFVFSDTFRAALNTRLSYDVACNCKI